MANCAACSPSAPRSMPAAMTARSCWCPKAPHGTNPATAAFCGFTVENIPADARGRVDIAALKARLGPDVAAVMITNPNTCGLFEPDMIEICDAVHAAGGFVYCDGANFNAIVGRVRPGDLGIDAMHINLHKTFSHAPWRRRPRLRPGGVLGGARARSRRCRSSRKGKDGLELVEESRRASRRTTTTASAAWSPSTARWACSSARSATC